MPKKPIYVTQPQLPPLEEFLPYLERIWESSRVRVGLEDNLWLIARLAPSHSQGLVQRVSQLVKYFQRLARGQFVRLQIAQFIQYRVWCRAKQIWLALLCLFR